MLPAIPSALVARSASSPPSRAAAAVAPKIPQIAVGWKPRLWKAPGVAMPIRVTISFPAMIAVSSSRPLAPRASASAAAGGHDHGAHVRDRVGVRVVEVEPVAEHRVRERRVRRRQACVEPDHGRFRRAAELGHRLAALARDPEPVGGEPAADHVEHVQLRRLDHLVRDRVEVELQRELRKALRCRRHHVLHSSSVPGKLRSACGAVRL